MRDHCDNVLLMIFDGSRVTSEVLPQAYQVVDFRRTALSPHTISEAVPKPALVRHLFGTSGIEQGISTVMASQVVAF